MSGETHGRVEGVASAGKSTLALYRLIEQLALRGAHSLVAIDLKGDSRKLLAALGTALPVHSSSEDKDES